MFLAQHGGVVKAISPKMSTPGRNERTPEEWLYAVLYSGQVTRVGQHLALVLFHLANEKGVAELSLRDLQSITGWGRTTIYDHLGEIETFIKTTLGRGRAKSVFELQGLITEAIEQVRSVRQPDTKGNEQHSCVRQPDSIPDTNLASGSRTSMPNTTADTKPSVRVPDAMPDTKPISVRQPDTKSELGGTIGGETNNYPITKNEVEEKKKAEVAEAHRRAMEAGERLKGGKVAKSGRAVQATQGELDGSKGIKFEGGKLAVVNGAYADLVADFPGVNLQAVFNKVAPEIAKNKYPTMELAMSLIRKWAQFAADDVAKGGRTIRGTAVADEGKEARGSRWARKLEARTEGKR
jgi:hypothetical protein